MKILGNVVIFVIMYVLFMLPTYILPYVGSNSSITMGAAAAQEGGMLPGFWLHLAALIVLIVVTWFRGALIDKKWLVIFPILAAIFDMTPGLSSIPLVPTVMHLLAIILGVVAAKALVPETQQAN